MLVSSATTRSFISPWRIFRECRAQRCEARRKVDARSRSLANIALCPSIFRRKLATDGAALEPESAESLDECRTAQIQQACGVRDHTTRTVQRFRYQLTLDCTQMAAKIHAAFGQST